MTATLPSTQGEKCQNTHRDTDRLGPVRKALHDLELAECCIKCALPDVEKPIRARLNLVLGHLAMEMDLIKATLRGYTDVDEGAAE